MQSVYNKVGTIHSRIIFIVAVVYLPGGGGREGGEGNQKLPRESWLSEQ